MADYNSSYTGPQIDEAVGKALTPDATPTENSTGLVQSGGVYADVRTRVPVYGMGKNLLRNWYFGNPVNQRGLSAYTGVGYGVDGWKGRNVSTQVTVGSGSISLNATASGASGILDQAIENPEFLLNKRVTISAIVGGTLETHKVDMPSSYSPGYIITGSRIYLGVESDGSVIFRFVQAYTWQLQIVAAKLELGSEQTLCHNEGTSANPVWVLNDVPDYEYELYRCMTSTADPSDTYANKSLATEQQIAYVETGTTASRNYTAGQYICWNGLTYTADTNIALGATLSASGGNKNLSECVGGGFNDITPFTVTPSSGVTINSQSNYKIGNLVFLYFEFAISSSLAPWTSVVTLPFPAFFGAFYLLESGAMPVSQVLYSPDNYTVSKGRNALPAGVYLVSVMGHIPR